MQLNNGDLHVDIPLLDLPGLGIPIHIHFIYDNKIWNYNSNAPADTYTVNQDRSPSFISYPGNVYFSSATTSPVVVCGTQSYPDAYLIHMSFVDEEGTAHPFNVNGYIADSPPCDYSPAPTLMYAADSSGIVGYRTTNLATLSKAITKSGTVYTFPASDNVMMEDSNGNELTAVTAFNSAAKTTTTTITDTAGRVFTISGEYQYGYQPGSITYTDQNGATQTITISYTSFAVNTAPLCALENGFTCVATVGPSVWVPAVITLPGGLTYTFSFQQNSPADLQSLTLPTGGVISWTYGQTDVSGDKVLSRTVTANGQTSLWSYNYVMSSSQGANTSNIVTVTDPFLNDTQYTCTIYAPKPLGLSGTAQLQPCSMTQEQAFAGSAKNGTLIVTKNTAYNVTGVVLPLATTVTWAATGQVAETDTSWDSIPNSGFYTGGDNPANDVSRGDVLSRIDYGYGSGAHGALLRNTQYMYEYQQNSAYVAPNIVDRLYQQSVYNSLTQNSSTLVAQTTTAYDQFDQTSINAQGALASAPGTTNHDYNAFGTTATLRGLPTSVTRVVGSGMPAIVTCTDYNDLGSPTIATDGNRNSTTYSYGAENAFLSSVTQPATNGMKHVDLYNYDTNTGLLMLHTDQNNVLTKYNYDSLRRPTLVDSAVGARDCCNFSAESKTVYSYPSATEVDVNQDQSSTGDGALKGSTLLDGLGRTIKAVARDGSVVETAYDTDNRVCAVSNPTFNDPGPLSCVVGANKTTASTDGYTYFSYDALGRKTVQTQPDGNKQHWAHNDNVVDFYDEDNSHWQWTSDALGRLTKVLENDPAGSGSLTLETDYTYDALDNLLSVNQKGASGDTARYRTFAYDSLSRLTNTCNPEAVNPPQLPCTPTAGPWSAVYLYDANGNVTTRTDARGIITHYTYDSLNRMTAKSYTNDPANTPALSYGYDTEYPWQLVTNENNPIGHLNSIMATLGSTNLVTWTSNDYDQRGNLLGYTNCLGSNAQSCNGTGASAAYDFDLDSKIASLAENVSNNSPNNQTQIINYGYDTAGRLNNIATTVYLDSSGNSVTSTAFANPTYYPAGLVESGSLNINAQTQAPGIALSRAYDNRRRLTGETDVTPAQQSYTYSVNYDGNGNVTGYNDSVVGAWTVTSDSLHRLSNLTGTVAGVSYVVQEAYDHFGNRNVETVTSGPNQMQPSFYLNFTAGNNRVNYGNSDCTSSNPSYDCAGNLLYDGTNNYLYDAEGRVCAVQQATTGGGLIGYLYAPDGLRLGKGALSSFTCDLTKNGMLTPNGLALTNIYTVGPNGEQLQETDGNLNFIHFDVFWEGNLLGTYTGSTYAQANWQFAVHDWTGTKRATSNLDGTSYTTIQSLPFGDYQYISGSASDPSEHHFTGKERDIESNLDYFPARYYNSNLGRFLSPDDGSDQDPSDPQSWNLYSYVQNNPLTNVDPDGHDCVTQSRVDGSSESVSVSSGGCSGAAGNGTTQTYVNGSVNLSDIHTGADGHSIDIGFTGANGSTGVQNADAAPYADNPGISLGNNQPGMFQMSGTNRVVNQIGGAMFAATTYFMGGLLGDTAPETGLLSGVGKTRISINWAHQLLDVRPGHLPPPGSQDVVQQAIQAAVDQGKFSTSANGVVQGTTQILGTDVGFRGKMVDGVLRISTVFTKR